MRKEIIELSSEVWNNSELKNTINKYSEEIKDLSDTTSDIVKPIKAFVSIYQYVQKVKFKRFLTSYAKKINEVFESREDLIDKMTKYLESEKNLNFIYNTIDSAINANSTLCSGIIGYFAGIILSEQKRLDSNSMIYLNALRSLNDFDLLLAIKVLENKEGYTKNQTISKIDKFSTNIESYEYVVQKLKGLQIIKEIKGEPGNPVGLGQSFWGTYRLTDVSRGFLDLIKKSGYYEEIINQ